MVGNSDDDSSTRPQSSDTSPHNSDIGLELDSRSEIEIMKTVKLSEVLKRELQQRNLTQAKVARDIDMSTSLLGDWISSRRLPSAKQFPIIHRLSAYLGLSLEELIFDLKPSEKHVLASTQFTDEGRQYRILIEKTGEKK